jgi:hypothetical protein
MRSIAPERFTSMPTSRHAAPRGLRRVVIKRIGGYDPEHPEASRDPTLEAGPTPGPWRLSDFGPSDDDPRCAVESESGKLICSTIGGNDQANATLISAVWDLADACEFALRYCPSDIVLAKGQTLPDVIRAALTKAGRLPEPGRSK